VAAILHLLQPLFRLDGRLRHGLTPWRRRGHPGRLLVLAREVQDWRQEWSDPYDDLRAVRGRLVALDVLVRIGGDFDAWDLEVAGGTLGGARLTTLVEEHERGRLLRARLRPTWSRPALVVLGAILALALAAAGDGALLAAAILLVVGASLGLRMLAEAGSAIATARAALPPALDPAAAADPEGPRR
jgi:hypothetical protein